MRVVLRMRSRAGLHGSDLRPVVEEGDVLRVSFEEPERVVGVLVDGTRPERAVRARTADGDVFELPREPVAELGGVRLPRATLLASELELSAPRAAEITIDVDYEVHALGDFGRAHRLDFQALACGRESFEQFHGYRILRADPVALREIEAVAISRTAGRFGNHLMQLVHATHAALELGLETIYVPAIPWFAVAAPRVNAGGVTYVAYTDLDEIGAPALFGTFLFEDLEPAVPLLHGELRQRLVDRHVAGLFRPPALAGAARPATHVAVHIRSGDLFDRPDPHPNFVQPPLAYFTTALRHFAAARSGVHVTFVYEDEGNPVIAALRAFLDGAGVPFTVASASLASDLATLLEHRALVLGRGSFGVAVAALSTNIQTLYFPWSEPRLRGLSRERDLNAFRVDEISPQYIPEGSWRNSREQRRLMIEYPSGNLGLTELSRSKERGPARGLSR